jgi:hypothetical protein
LKKIFILSSSFFIILYQIILTDKEGMMNRKRLSFMGVLLIVLFIPTAILASEFSGGGGSIYFATGAPNSIDAVSELGDNLGVNGGSGNYVFGVQGFFQGHRYRMGGSVQAHAWAGVNLGKEDTEDDVAGLAVVVGGFYGSYTLKYDRMLLNVGAVVGAGRCFLGYSLGDGEIEREESVSTFFIEPQLSVGVATSRWFGVEFQLSTPIFILTDDLRLAEGERIYTVRSSDMMGVNFGIKLTFGKIANF